MKKLFVGSLSWDTTNQSLQDFFAQVGTVTSATVIVDKFTNRSRGFGFVEMPNDDEAQKAIDELNGKELDGRAIVVNEARPMERRDDNRGGFNRNSSSDRGDFGGRSDGKRGGSDRRPGNSGGFKRNRY